MIVVIIILLIALMILTLNKERFNVEENIMKDRFIGQNSRKYINQIDWYRDSPNIDLEREINYYGGISPDDIDWTKVNDYQYSKIVGYLQGKYDATKIKSINAL